jgi:citrate synthase
MKKSPYLTAAEAANELNVSLMTLYAYVSRGLIRSEAIAGSKRNRRYHADDVQKLKERQEQRRNPGKAVANALHWGMPLMESGLTLIADGKVYYRGHDAIELASDKTVEQVASLIWAGETDTDLWKNAKGRSFDLRDVRKRIEGLSAVDAFQAALPIVAAQDVAAYDLRPTAVAQTGVRILRLLVALTANRTVESSLARTLMHGWGFDDPKATALINSALILCADHELNVSAFTARCVASAGATPYQVVIAGLAALRGMRHGGQSEQVEALLDEAGGRKAVRAVLVNRLKRGEHIPGFGHQLYSEGDPRSRALLQFIMQAYPKSPAVTLAKTATNEVMDLIGEHPNIDFALIILARALKLPVGSALTLFALGRTIGWIGHAIEQYYAGYLIRPRAQYIGEPPNKAIT